MKTLSTGVWTYNYDTGSNGKGRMVSVTKGTEGYFYDGYDAMGRLTAGHQVTNVDGVDRSYSLSYGYDLAGNLTSQQYPSGRVITTSFDPAARLNSVTGQKAGESNKTYASQYQYTPHGGISSMMMANGLMQETMSYNSRLQPFMIELRKTADNSLLLGLDYTYNTVGQANNNGNVHTQTIRFGATTFSQAYTYDSLNRLETAMETGSWSQTYGYDRWGNRRVSQSTGYPIEADLTPTQPTHISTSTNRITMPGFDYDTSGNQTQQIRSSQSETLNYDSENRMTSFVSGSTTTSYVYDGDGRRVKKVTGTETTVFVYNAGGQLIAEYSTGQPQGSGTSYLTTDHLGSTRLVTDASGSVKARHDYLPFGEETGAGIGSRTAVMGYGAMDSTRQRFTSKERDTESGLDYFGARYYSGAGGRFASPDPIFFQKEMPIDPQRFNLFAYVRNNPLKFVDPKGEEIELTGDKEARDKQLEAIRKAVGKQAGAYLYEIQVGAGKNVRYIVGVLKNGPDGNGPGFGDLNRIASAIGQIINSSRVVEIITVGQGTLVRGLEGRVARIGRPSSGLSPAATSIDPSPEAGRAQIFILDPAEGYGNYPSYLMSDGSAPALDEGLVIAHEFGHLLYGWGLVWVQESADRSDDGKQATQNRFAVELENSARRLRDPNAALRIRHNRQDEPIKTNPRIH